MCAYKLQFSININPEKQKSGTDKQLVKNYLKK